MQPTWTHGDVPPDFTSARYQLVCERFLKGADCRLFTEELQVGSVFLRHDVDFSLNRARAMGLIEQSYGIRSTFFVDPLSPYYSIFEPSQRSILAELIGMGHAIGLHFDSNRHNPATLDELESAVHFEKGILQSAGVSPTAISFHNPRDSDLEIQASVVGGLVNAYSKALFRDIDYVSDSNGRWKYQSLESALGAHSESGTALQILIHPEWWQESELPPRARLHRSIAGRLFNQIGVYDEFLAKASRSNITGMPEPLEALVLGGAERGRELDLLWNLGMYNELAGYLSNVVKRLLLKSLFDVAVLDWGIPRKTVEDFLNSSHKQFRFSLLFELATKAFQDIALEGHEFDVFDQHLHASEFKTSPVNDDRELIAAIQFLARIVSLLEFASSRQGASAANLLRDVSTQIEKRIEEQPEKYSKHWERFKHEVLSQ